MPMGRSVLVTGLPDQLDSPRSGECMGRPMVFWKKRIELPTIFYQATGDCFLYFMESQTKVQKIEASFMTVNNACDLLDLVKEGFTKLADLITIFPLKSDQLIAQFDMTEDILISSASRHAAQCCRASIFALRAT
jgi:hypothetical protein